MIELKLSDIIIHKPTGYIGKVIYITNSGQLFRCKLLNSKKYDSLSYQNNSSIEKLGEMQA